MSVNRSFAAISTISLLTLNVVLATLLGAKSADAHTNAEFYSTSKWTLNKNVDYYIDDSNPSGEWRESLKQGMARWSDRASGRGPAFTFVASGPQGAPGTPCLGNNALFRNDLPFGVLATTGKCGQPTITGFDVQFATTPDFIAGTGEVWYVGDGIVPSNAWDLQSIAVHEAGHVTGWSGHFDRDDNTLCPNDTELAQTMCGGEDRRGTKGLRTLQDHDEHTIANAYPAP